MKNIEYNPYLLTTIQPIGGISFKERAIWKGDGYEACIRLYKIKSNVNFFWLEDLLGFEDVTTTIDIESENQEKILESINRSISEQMTRAFESKDNIDKIMARSELDMLQGLVEEITQNEEVIKLVTIRYYVSALTIAELDMKIKEILIGIQNLGYRGAVCINEQEYEWRSLFTSPSEQKLFLNKRTGEPIPSMFLGAGYPFHFTELSDKTGTYLGRSFTGGNVIFDLFTRNDYRKSFNALIIGLMGSGKSTLLKKLLKNNSILERTLRILDVTGEFTDLAKELGGKVVSLDGTDGIINPLQIFATIIDENTNMVLEEQSYMLHINKVSMLYQFLSPDSEEAEIREFERIVSDFYSHYGIERDKATTYKTNEYPIMEELLEYARKELYSDVDKMIVKKNLTETKKKRLEIIILNLDSIVRDYGTLFNGHSTIDNFEEEQLVSFQIKNLAQFNKRIFNAQTFNVMTMLWNNALKQGLRAKKLYDDGIISYDDSKKYLLLIDEAHKFVNSNNIMAVDYLISFEREARKYFGGLIFATQSIRDVVPENSSSEALQKIKTLFELTQYKFIMQQDNNSKKAILDIFNGQLTESEIEGIPYFKKGECILAINGYKNIKFKVEVTNRELDIFKGGA
ncbi:ATP-binding protein [Clostridium sp. Sa3CUN1]|uniref:ATP-binding protein n=1 Tax=Clostridium gallinarum TaxID=2762246 RepID=A0ABR8Q786_9CLOT|nr:ATP-binding protein [Clostridium gallinarum]MBD7916292.1 ATP-binding protein [Clostridium gallinarum]